MVEVVVVVVAAVVVVASDPQLGTLAAQSQVWALKLNFVPCPQAVDVPTCAPLTQVMNEVQVGSLGSAILVCVV